MERIIDKRKHIHVGQQVKIILARNEEISKGHGYTTLGAVYTITDRPTKLTHKNGDKGVWVEIDGAPVFVWFFECKPYIPSKIVVTRTIFPTFHRTKF